MIIETAVGVFIFGAGYVARKYVEKKWPNESALVDAIATRYGEAAATRIAVEVAAIKANAADPA